MNTIKINRELDINRNPEYKNFLQEFKPKNIRSFIRDILQAGKVFERNYSIRHNTECERKENDFINKLTELEKWQQDRIYTELIKLKQENIALKNAIKKHNIKVLVTNSNKFYKVEEKEII